MAQSYVHEALESLRLELDSIFTSKSEYSVTKTQIRDTGLVFRVIVYTEAFANSQLDTDKFEVRNTMLSDDSELHNLELHTKVSNEHLDK